MNFEENLSEYLSQEFIEDLLKAQEEKRTTSLILNTTKIDKETFKNMFPEIQEHEFMENVFYYDKEKYQLGKNFLFDNGVYYLIDTSSLLVSYYLPTKDGDFILDMCSAPGGKTISLLLKNKEQDLNIIANDLSHERSLELSKNIERQGFGNVIVTNNDFEKVYDSYLEKFDCIILDAPCSGSAMFRKNDLAKKDWTMNKVLKAQEIQKRLIAIAIRMLKKGGYLMYSTCSFSKEENEDVILYALSQFDNIKPVKIEEKFCYYRTSALPEAIHLFPNLYKGEGQFICLLHKEGETFSNSKNLKKSITHKDIIQKYSINLNSEKIINNQIYFYNNFIDISKLNVLRYGLHAGEINKNIFKPSFQLAHYLSSSKSIELNEDEFKAYIHGDEIRKNLQIKNDFYVVSYKGINLGFVKYVDGKLKNFYPKGLRH